MRHNPIIYVALSLIAAGFGSCKADIDLNNIDTRMQVGMGLAIPIGDMTVTAGDFLGNGQIPTISVDEEGVFHFRDTVDVPTRNYHFLELNQESVSFSGTIPGSALQEGTYTLPLQITIDGLNDPNISEDKTNYERIDSIQLKGATITVTLSDMQAGLSSLKLVLGKQFGQLEGQEYSLRNGVNTITLPAFTADFMIDHAATGKNNVVNYLGTSIAYTAYSIDETKDAFAFDVNMQIDDYTAAWGYFQASNKMQDRDEICIADEWPEWKEIQKLKIRLMEPTIRVTLHHQVAAPLFMRLDTLRVSNAQEFRDATFDVAETLTKDYFPIPDPLSPYGPFSDFSEPTREYSYSPFAGHIDKLFDIHPDTIKYSFTLTIPTGQAHPDYRWTQHRILNNTEVSGYAAVDLPFKVNEGSEAQYATTFSDVNLESVNLDSLLKEVKVVEETKAAHIKLFLTVSNSLPFDVDAKVWFLDKDSNDINLLLFDNQAMNEIHLPAPEMEKIPGNPYGYVKTPSVSTLIIDVDQEKCDILSTCKKIRLDAFIGKNPKPCTINTKNSLKLQVGVAANVEAIMNFNQEDSK